MVSGFPTVGTVIEDLFVGNESDTLSSSQNAFLYYCLLLPVLDVVTNDTIDDTINPILHVIL